MYFPFWLIVIGVVILFIYLRNKEKKQDVVLPKNVSPQKNEIKEETVFEVQTKFERKLQDTFLPDAIKGKESYIYKYLMFPWCEELLGKHHYDDKMIQKIRKDWIDYMGALKEDADCKCLYKIAFFETDRQEEAGSYMDRGRIASKKAEEIENTFAFSIGKEAVDELFRIRNTAEEDFPQMILKQPLKKNSAQRLKNNK